MNPPSIKKKKIAVLIPCYNEEKGIRGVIEGFPIGKARIQGYEISVIVIDNNSDDSTAEVARSHGVTVLHEPRKGKGNAIRRGFQNIPSDVDYVVMLDGDNTYRPEEVLRLVEPIDSGFCNVIVGSRLGGRITDGSMDFLNRAGNWVFSHLVRYAYQVNVTDVLTGYFAWKREVVEKLHPHLKSEGFAIEMEMITKMARLGEEIYSVPISYHARVGESSLRPFYDGSRILLMLLRNLYWRPQPRKIQRIAFVTDAVMPYHKGGKEKRLYEIAKRLVSADREVHIYTMHWWDGPKIIQREGIYFHAISKLHPLYHGEHRSISEAVIFGLATFKLLLEPFDVLDVDHMPFFPLWSARIVTWLKGKKLQATWHEVWGYSYWQEYAKGFVGFIGSITERISFALPDVIISNSEHTTARLRAAGVKVNIVTIPLGVDLEDIYAAAPRVEKSDIIFVGRLLSHKNVDLLVRAIAIVRQSIPDIICKIVGTGPEKQRLDELIKNLKLNNNIHILGNVEHGKDLYGLMKSSRVLVLPSTREGFGLVVLEANAAGLPVITTSHEDNAAKDLITEGTNGLLAEPNPESIAGKIIQIFNTQEAMQPQREVDHYSWQIVAEHMKQFLASYL